MEIDNNELLDVMEISERYNKFEREGDSEEGEIKEEILEEVGPLSDPTCKIVQQLLNEHHVRKILTVTFVRINDGFHSFYVPAEAACLHFDDKLQIINQYFKIYSLKNYEMPEGRYNVVMCTDARTVDHWHKFYKDLDMWKKLPGKFMVSGSVMTFLKNNNLDAIDIHRVYKYGGTALTLSWVFKQVNLPLMNCKFHPAEHVERYCVKNHIMAMFAYLHLGFKKYKEVNDLAQYIARWYTNIEYCI